MSLKREAAVDVFPERECEACGRRGGGNPEKGLDNVLVHHKHQLCGHCVHAFEAYRASTVEQQLVAWKAESTQHKPAAPRRGA